MLDGNVVVIVKVWVLCDDGGIGRRGVGVVETRDGVLFVVYRRYDVGYRRIGVVVNSV